MKVIVRINNILFDMLCCFFIAYIRSLVCIRIWFSSNEICMVFKFKFKFKCKTILPCVCVDVYKNKIRFLCKLDCKYKCNKLNMLISNLIKTRSLICSFLFHYRYHVVTIEKQLRSRSRICMILTRLGWFHNAHLIFYFSLNWQVESKWRCRLKTMIPQPLQLWK